MKKSEELGRLNSCLSKAKPDELIFVLLERDPSAARAVRAWANDRVMAGRNQHDDPQIVEALEWADRVDDSHETGAALRFKDPGYTVGEEHPSKTANVRPQWEYLSGEVSKEGAVEVFTKMSDDGWKIMTAWTQQADRRIPGRVDVLAYIARRKLTDEDFEWTVQQIAAKDTGETEVRMAALYGEGWEFASVKFFESRSLSNPDYYEVIARRLKK